VGGRLLLIESNPSGPSGNARKFALPLENVQKTVGQKENRSAGGWGVGKKKASCKTVNCYAHCPLPPTLSPCVSV